MSRARPRHGPQPILRLWLPVIYSGPTAGANNGGALSCAGPRASARVRHLSGCPVVVNHILRVVVFYMYKHCCFNCPCPCPSTCPPAGALSAPNRSDPCGCNGTSTIHLHPLTIRVAHLSLLRRHLRLRGPICQPCCGLHCLPCLAFINSCSFASPSLPHAPQPLYWPRHPVASTHSLIDWHLLALSHSLAHTSTGTR